MNVLSDKGKTNKRITLIIIMVYKRTKSVTKKKNP